MDGGAWRVQSTGGEESDTTEVTYHAQTIRGVRAEGP